MTSESLDRRRWLAVGVMGVSLCVLAVTLSLTHAPSLRTLRASEAMVCTGRCDWFNLELKFDGPEVNNNNQWISASFSGQREVNVEGLDGTVTLAASTGLWTNGLNETFNAEWLIKFESKYNHFYVQTGGSYSSGGSTYDIFAGAGLKREWDAGAYKIALTTDVTYRNRSATDGGGEFQALVGLSFRW